MLKTYRIIFSLITPRDRRRFFALLGLVLISVAFEVVGIASILPLLQVLADPDVIQTNRILNWAYTIFTFKSAKEFSFALGIVVFCLIVLGLALKSLTLYALTRFAVMRAFNISSRLLNGSLHQPYTWFLNRHGAGLSTTVLGEVNSMVSGTMLPALQILPSIVSAAMILGFILVIEPYIAIGAFTLLGGSYVIIYTSLQDALKRLGEVRLQNNKKRFRIVQDATGGIKELKLMGLESSYTHSFQAAAFLVAKSQSKSMIIRQLPRFALEAISFGGLVLMLLYLIARGNGNLEEVLPTLGFIVVAIGRLFPALQQVYRHMSNIRFNTATLANVHQAAASLTLPKPQKLAELEAVPPIGLRNSLRLNDVSYQYPEAEKTAIANTSLTIPARTTIGIVGGTGAGKTTVVDLILGLLSPDSGEIQVDGKTITPDLRRGWQKSIGYVPQQIFLTDSSVASNIAMGSKPEDIDMEAVIRAAKIASLHDFVLSEMPEGYETTVGERGIRLSGGQRQRIGIARALYHDPDVLIMDEATSALDNLTERAVMEAVHKIAGEKTIIMIAHRLTTVENCDTIFLLQHGKVLTSGTYKDLLKNSPEFQEMVTSA